MNGNPWRDGTLTIGPPPAHAAFEGADATIAAAIDVVLKTIPDLTMQGLEGRCSAFLEVDRAMMATDAFRRKVLGAITALAASPYDRHTADDLSLRAEGLAGEKIPLGAAIVGAAICGWAIYGGGTTLLFTRPSKEGDAG